MSDLGYAVSLICKFHRDCHRGPGRDIAITLVSRIWAPALLIFRAVSKDGERDPRFVKPLGDASILAVNDRGVVAQIPPAASTA
jgi:hypothetical protein